MNIATNSIKIKKIILSGLQTSGYPFHKEMDKILHGLLMLNFNAELEESAILTASQYILAYLQLGFSYLEHKNLFDSILSAANYTAAEISILQKGNTPIIINKLQIRSLFGRWSASPYNSHTIVSAVNEIIRHTFEQEYGVYQYYTAKKDGTYTALYELTVSTDYIIFHNIFQNRYYSLIKE